MAFVRVARLDEWIETELKAEEPILIRGGFRKGSSGSSPTVEICELDGIKADTISIRIPANPSVQSSKPDTASFNDGGMKWWNTWAAVFAATSIIPPVIDHVRLFDLLNEKRRVRFCCDTNALCNGVVAWLLFILNGRADVFTSAVVDRELAAWPDHYKNFWQARTLELWLRRTHFRLARRLIETPPDGVVVDRLSPEQGALMLAKLRDESNYKSPDADMLLIELARGLARDQPRNARVLYLTGDRNNARAATNALGADNVLYAVADGERVRQVVGAGAKRARGWWSPNGPLGTLLTPQLSRFLWDLLAACDFLVLETDYGQWQISPINSFNTGVPSDWEDPWVDVVSVGIPHTSISSMSATKGSNTPVPGELPDENNSSNVATPDNVVMSASTTPIDTLALSGDYAWLLPPIEIKAPILAPVSRRPTPKITFALLWRVLNNADDSVEENFNADLEVEASKILLSLGAIDEQGGPGERIEEFRRAWDNNDLDWLHGEFLRLNGYLDVINAMRSQKHEKLPNWGQVILMMARSLGQVARLSGPRSDYFVGDAALNVTDLQAALDRWLPREGDTLATDELCVLASKDLHLTPYRFEIAMQAFWKLVPNTPFEGRTGGTVIPGPIENVVVLSTSGFQFQPVSPGALTFGRNGQVRFISRIGP